MSNIKNVILGTTRKGRALRVTGLCVALAITALGTMYLAQPAIGESQPPSLRNAVDLSSTHDADDFGVLAESLTSAENPTGEIEGTESSPTQAESATMADEMIASGDSPTVAMAEQSQVPHSDSTGAEVSPNPEQSPSTSSHAHQWIDQTQTIHHDAVYTTVWHNPVYETRTTYHDVCVQCRAILDGGKAAEHLKNTSCTNYRTGVPFTEQVLVSEGYSEQVLITAAYDETIIVGRYCACGAKSD